MHTKFHDPTPNRSGDTGCDGQTDLGIYYIDFISTSKIIVLVSVLKIIVLDLIDLNFGLSIHFECLIMTFQP